MNTAEHSRMRLARQIVWSLDVGVLITLLLAILETAHVAPGVTDVLLRPLLHLLHGAHAPFFSSISVVVATDTAIYSLLSFLLIRMWSHRRRRASFAGLALPERRRGFRVAAAVPVFVYGWAAGEPFSESAETVNVSEFGALIPLSVKVEPSQELVLTNLRTERDVTCRVVRSGAREDGMTLAGLAFPEASPDFWQIEFVVPVPGPKAEPPDAGSEGGEGA